jgi:hypothetical protein
LIFAGGQILAPVSLFAFSALRKSLKRNLEALNQRYPTLSHFATCGDRQLFSNIFPYSYQILQFTIIRGDNKAGKNVVGHHCSKPFLWTKKSRLGKNGGIFFHIEFNLNFFETQA